MARNQSGAALIMVLLLLIIVTLLGLASMRGALMQEKMAASTAARALAFQAAESGLRQAENIARGDSGVVTFPAAGCSAGRCANPLGTTSAWQASDFWADGGSGYQTGTPVGSGVSAIAPRFVIEDNGMAVPVSDPSSGSGGSSSNVGCNHADCETVDFNGRQNVYRITSYAATASGGEVILQSLYRR